MKVPTMDLAKLAITTEPVRMVLMNPITRQPITDDEGNESALLLVGMDSDRYLEVERKLNNRKLKQLQQQNKLRLTAEEVEAENLERITAAVVGVEHIVFDGEPLEYGEKGVTKLLGMPWLREQVEAFISERAHFIKG